MNAIAFRKVQQARVLSVVRLILACLACLNLVRAAAIDPARLPPAGRWEPGIPGGIPANYTQFCNVRVSIPGSTLRAVGDGVTDDTAAINAALELCPDNQYVFLPEGNYRCNGQIGRFGGYQHDGVQRPFSVVLRGDGPSKTRIYSYAAGNCIAFGQGLGPIGGGTIISGNTRGSTSIVAPLPTPGLFSVGKWMLVRRSNAETGVVNTPGYMNDTCSQFVRVLSVTPSGGGQYTITFTPALNEGYPGDSVGMPCSVPYRCGIEDLYVERMTESSNNNIVLVGAQECWVRNVESNKARKWHIRLNSTAGCEVRECYVHDAWQAGGDAGYGVGLFGYTCNTLVENNIGVRLRHAYILEWGGQNNVIGYNYSKDPINNDRGPGTANQLLTDYLMGDLTLHGGHPRWNLFEGNVGAILRFDYVLGGSNYTTAFRNRIQRKGLPSTYVANTGSDIQRGNHQVNLVGNVYEDRPANSGAPLRRWGTNQDDASNPDPLSFSTAYLHGEYELATGTVTWDPANADHVLPDSFYRSTKPAFFGAQNWPLFGPTAPGSASDLPAVGRYQTISAPVAPTFVVSPQPASVVQGASVSLTTIVQGSSPFHFQWLKNGTAIAGAITPTLALGNVQAGDQGAYTVTVTNAAGSVTSGSANLTVTAGAVAPTIATHPQAISVRAGDAATLTAVVTGSTPLTYQWRHDGVVIPNATAAAYVIPSVAGLHAGSYTVTATNSAGNATSNAAVLTVTANSAMYSGVAVAPSGALFVTDSAGNQIREIQPGGEWRDVAGGAGTAGFSDGGGATARFNQPYGIARTPSGDLIVADAGNATLRRISGPSVTTLAGSVSARGNVDGSGGTAQFNQPLGVALDAAGNIYVADAFSSTIRRVTAAGQVTTLAGQSGVRGHTDGQGTAAQFNQPSAVAVDPAGTLYVADASSHVIRRITPTGAVSTLAGLAGVGAYANGTGEAAQFNQPLGVALDATGNIYVSDSANNVIRKVSPAGVVTTLAGLPGVAGLVDGPGSAAQFNHPRGLAVDHQGTVFVADTGNARIRRITPAGTVSTVTTFEASGPTPVPPAQPPGPANNTSAAGGGGGAIGAHASLLLIVLCTISATRADRRAGARPPGLAESLR